MPDKDTLKFKYFCLRRTSVHTKNTLYSSKPRNRHLIDKPYFLDFFLTFSLVLSTLMVLLSNSDEDFESLWRHTGGYNDTAGKHLQPPDVIAKGGNFRSARVDQWTNASFETVKKKLTRL